MASKDCNVVGLNSILNQGQFDLCRRLRAVCFLVHHVTTAHDSSARNVYCHSWLDIVKPAVNWGGCWHGCCWCGGWEACCDAQMSTGAAWYPPNCTHPHHDNDTWHWAKGLNLTQHKTGQFGDALPSRSLGMVWQKLNPMKKTHTHPFNGPFSGTTRVSRYQKGETIWILLKQETVSGSGISWAICKSASRSRQTTTPVPHHSVFLQAGCPSCRPTNSVKALKVQNPTKNKLQKTTRSKPTHKYT